MSEKTTDLNNWVELASQYVLPNWEQLSSIPLYMDQVILFMSEAFSLFENNDKTPVLTSSMINNYVKNGLVEHPIHKKYNREHLAKLVMVGMLKQVLAIQDIAVLFSEGNDSKAFYEAFKEAQDAALHDTLSAVTLAQNDPNALRATALRLSAEANARRIAAQQILSELSMAQQIDEPKAKKHQKSK